MSIEKATNYVYNLDKLSFIGKEYYYGLFTFFGESPSSLIFWFLRANRPFKTDDAEGLPSNITENEDYGVCYAWYFQNGRTAHFPKEQCRIKVKNEVIELAGKTYNILIEGQLPNAKITIIHENTKILDTQCTSNNIKTHDIFGFSRLKNGYHACNIYSLVSGKLNDKRVEGKFYLQKVTNNTLLMPWKWVKLDFKDGSYITAMDIYLGVKRLKRSVKKEIFFYHAPSNKLYSSGNVKFIEKDNNTWAVFNPDGDFDFYMEFESYANSLTHIKSLGTFSYNAYFAKLKDFQFKSGEFSVGKEYIDSGYGTFENATRYTI